MNVEWIHHIGAKARSKGMRIAALVLAAITWYAIQPAISFEATLSDVPLRVLVDPGWAVLEQSVASVDVHFRGSREGIRYLSQEQLEVVADVRGRTYEDSLTIPLELRSVRAPAGVRAIFIRPSEVILSVDQEEDRELPVRVHIQGTPPEGYEIEAMTTTPATVTVSGPRQRLDAIEAIRTVPIDMEGRLQSFKLRVALVSPSRTWTARMEPERVEVEIVLSERSATAVFEDIRIKSLSGVAPWANVDIQPSRADLRLIGRSELLENLAAKDIQVYVDISSLEEGVPKELPIRVHLPPRVRLEQISPSNVTVTATGGERATHSAARQDQP